MQQRVSGSRLIEIDSLRGLAALWVVLFHFSFGIGYFWLKDDPGQAARVAPFNINIQGLLAVDLFFMISGFVILMTLEHTRSVADFVVARFARLYPAYWLCLAMTTAAIILVPEQVQSVTAGQVAANVTMVNLYIGSAPVESVYWSLAVELAFYTMMAVIFAFNRLHRLELYGAIWVALSVLLLNIFPDAGAMLPWRIKMALALPWAPLFFAGILIYRIRQDGFTPVRIGLLIACLVARVAVNALDYSIGTIVIFALFLLAATGRAGFLRFKPLTALGTISYPLYLVHQSIGFRIQDAAVMRLGMSAIGGFAVALISVIAIAAVVTFTVERRGQRLIRQAYARHHSLTLRPVS